MDQLPLWMRNPIGRRAFVTRMSAAGLGACAALLMTGCGGGDDGPAAPSAAFPNIPGRNVNEQTLNYALTLETLEADLYRQALNAASGRAASEPLVFNGTTPNYAAYTQTVGGGALSGQLAQIGFLYLVQFAYVEAAHRDFLRTAIQAGGGTPVSANAAGYKFATTDGTPGADLATILSNVYPLEEIGQRAYEGAVPFITDLGVAQAAATIHSTEARHAEALSYIVNNANFQIGPNRTITGVPTSQEPTSNPPSDDTFEKFLAPATVLQAAAASFFRS